MSEVVELVEVLRASIARAELVRELDEALEGQDVRPIPVGELGGLLDGEGEGDGGEGSEQDPDGVPP